MVFGFVLPYHGDTHDFSQPVPNGIGPLTLITDQKVAGLDRRAAPGVGAREERELGGHKYWVMPVDGRRRRAASLTFTLSGLPSTDSSGPHRRRRPDAAADRRRHRVRARGPTGGGARAGVGRRGRARRGCVDTREALFAELVALERTRARGGHAGAPADQRKQLVTRLEQVYRDLAALDEQRAA